MAGSVARWTIPSLVGAVGLASGRYLVLEAAVLAVAAAIAASLLIAGAITRAIEPSMNRWFARRACDWLEGRPIRPARGTNRGQAAFSRLYQVDAQEGST
jgi:peptidoglycan/LPS O-acetylase OafA/YrhL